jgi:hypothetical protein
MLEYCSIFWEQMKGTVINHLFYLKPIRPPFQFPIISIPERREARVRSQQWIQTL